VVATYRLKPEHVAWLTQRAVDRKVARRSRGRADVSEVLREVLDEALARLD